MAQTFSSYHPYFPQYVEIGSYLPNATPIPVLLCSFACIITITLATSLVLAKKVNPTLPRSAQLTLGWFVLCFFLHCFFEGYFVINHSSLPRSQSLFAQLWKEYALSDSRYLTSDPFVLCVESITVVVWGPLCLVIAICIVLESDLSLPLQIVMCIGHLYGVALYYGTCYFEYHHHAISHSRPEFLYYWVYYVGLNLPWALVPFYLLFHRVKEVMAISKAFKRVDSLLEKRAKAGDGIRQSKKRQ